MPQDKEWGSGSNAAVVPVTNTWSSVDRSDEIILSANYLTTTRSSAASNLFGIRAVISRLTGKYYHEITVNAIGGGPYNNGFGIANQSWPLTTSVGADLNSVGFFDTTQIDINNADSGDGPAFAAGNTVGFAFDLDNEKCWARNITTGLGWMDAAIGLQNPATNTGGQSFAALNAGPWFPALNHLVETDSATANFGATAYAAAAPAGFGNW